MLGEWDEPAPSLGALLAWVTSGVLVGAIVFSMLADKIGRRPVLVWATSVLRDHDDRDRVRAGHRSDAVAALHCRASAWAAIIPNATALVGEFSPKRTRVAWVMCITMGFTLGAAIGGFVANALIEAFGWRSVFIFGGVVPLRDRDLMFAGCRSRCSSSR